MGECLIVRRGGEYVSAPVLNTSYPSDATVMESANGSATFIVVQDNLNPDVEHVYQWYLDSSPISGATGPACTVTGLTASGIHSVHCVVANKGGTATSRVATLTVQSSKPVYTYSGSSQLINDGNYQWRIKFLTSGKLRFSYLGNASAGIDVFLLGGGGGGGYGNTTHKYGGSGGGGGGYTKTGSAAPLLNTDYTITVGAGGSSDGDGGTSSAFELTAAGGKKGYRSHLESGGGWGGKGGDGGSGGGAGQYGKLGSAGNGGSNGGNGGYGSTNIDTDSSNYRGGYGQGTTTKEFGESSGTLYAGGGGGGCGQYQGYGTAGAGGSGGGAAGEQSQTGVKSASANTGGGGGGCTGCIGYNSAGGSGGSGIVVIRNTRR